MIDQAVALEPAEVKNAANLNVKGMSDAELASKQELLKVFESARSYRASLIFQAMRLAEMDGRTPDRDRLKAEGEEARASFLQLSDVVKKIQAEIDERDAAKEAAKAGEKANSTAPANKK